MKEYTLLITKHGWNICRKNIYLKTNFFFLFPRAVTRNRYVSVIGKICVSLCFIAIYWHSSKVQIKTCSPIPSHLSSAFWSTNSDSEKNPLLDAKLRKYWILNMLYYKTANYCRKRETPGNKRLASWRNF